MDIILSTKSEQITIEGQHIFWGEGGHKYARKLHILPSYLFSRLVRAFTAAGIIPSQYTHLVHLLNLVLLENGALAMVSYIFTCIPENVYKQLEQF